MARQPIETTLGAGAEIIDLHDRSAAELAIEAFGRLADEHRGAYRNFLIGVHHLLTEEEGNHQHVVPFDVTDLMHVLDRHDRAVDFKADDLLDLHHDVDRYNRDESIYFCETEFYVRISRYFRDKPYCVEVVPRDETLRPFGSFCPPAHVKYRREAVKAKKLHSLDRYRITGRLYVFMTLLVLDMAATIVLASSARLISYSLLLPALYTIFLIYREATFVVNRIRLIRSVYSPAVRVKTLVYNEDKSMLKVSRFTVKGTCPICKAPINLSQGGTNYNGQIVGRCEASFLSHVFSYDPVMNTGHYLN